MDYSKTVNLPKTDFPMKADLPKREPEIQARWEKEKVYEQALARRAPQRDQKRFVLHDGPPYANGHLHLGHALNKILKDIIVRYKTMAGYYAPYIPGWDCHGLPIELQLMKELKVADKHKVDRAKFREQAKAFAEKFVDIQREEFKRMGVLGDWEHPYLTMAEDYKKTIVKTFEELQAKGYVYRGKKPVYWCSTDETALAEAEVEYENDTGPSIFVAFRHAWIDYFFVVWTTTPWTLPANVAIAYNPHEDYVLFEEAASKKKYVVAYKLLEQFKKMGGFSGEIVQQIPAGSLEGNEAHHPWIDRIVEILPADFVAMDTGTGLVHIAPGHGREDYVLNQKHATPFPVLSPVDDQGLFTEDFGDLKVKGEHVFKANAKIIEFLKEKGRLLYSGELTHSYPHCWRCHKPVIFRATEQWFLNIDHQDLRKRLLEVIDKEVRWIPGYGQNRIRGMVEVRPDWCLSRQRLWGTEIPDAPGSRLQAPGDSPRASSLEPRATDADIFDVWFESGVSWAAVLKNSKEWPELSYPADMYLEGSDQHRGWFQTSLIPSVALENKAPYKAVLTHGFVMDGEGRPMSKSLGNVISPEEVIKQCGADVLRLWVASADYGGDVRLSAEILKSLTDTYRKIRNTFRYMLGNLFDFNPKTDSVPFDKLLAIDQWVLQETQRLLEVIRSAYDKFEFSRATSVLVHFCSTTLSGLYLDILKDRLYCNGANWDSRRSAQTTLFRLTDTLIRAWVPIISFTADEVWGSLGKDGNAACADFPSVNEFEDIKPLDNRWEYLWDLKMKVNQQIEEQRKAGVIGSSLEAWVIIRQSNQVFNYLETVKEDLPGLLIVSKVTLEKHGMDELPEVRHAKEASCKRCVRCWNWRELGVDARWPDVCGRCAQAVEDWQKANPALAAEAKS